MHKFLYFTLLSINLCYAGNIPLEFNSSTSQTNVGNNQSNAQDPNLNSEIKIIKEINSDNPSNQNKNLGQNSQMQTPDYSVYVIRDSKPDFLNDFKQEYNKPTTSLITASQNSFNNEKTIMDNNGSTVSTFALPENKINIINTPNNLQGTPLPVKQKENMALKYNNQPKQIDESRSIVNIKNNSKTTKPITVSKSQELIKKNSSSNLNTIVNPPIISFTPPPSVNNDSTVPIITIGQYTSSAQNNDYKKYISYNDPYKIANREDLNTLSSSTKVNLGELQKAPSTSGSTGVYNSPASRLINGE